jgi:hypothetical protein
MLEGYDRVFRARVVDLPSGDVHDLPQSSVPVLWDRFLHHFSMLPSNDATTGIAGAVFQVFHRQAGRCHPVDTAGAAEPLGRVLVDGQTGSAVGLGRHALWWRRSFGWLPTPLPPTLVIDAPWIDLQLAKDAALVVGASASGAVLATPAAGVVWSTTAPVAWARVARSRALVRLADGEVLAISDNGRRLLRWLPPAGGVTLACADAGDDVAIAWQSPEVGIQLQVVRIAG